MIVDETLSNLRAYLEQERAKDPQLDAYLRHEPIEADAASSYSVTIYTGESAKRMLWSPPVVGSPLWFLEEVAEAYGQGRTDYLVDELCGLKVVQREELAEPVLILADGKTYTIVPEWARRTAEQIASEDARRRLGAVVGVS